MKFIINLQYLLVSISLLITLSLNSQNGIPNNINYQAVLRDIKGSILINKPVFIEVKIFNFIDSNLIEEERSEFFRDTTNEFGLINIQIGKGLSTGGKFKPLTEIEWSQKTSYSISISDESTSENIIKPQILNFSSAPFAIRAYKSFYSDTANFAKNISILDKLWQSSGDTIVYLSSFTEKVGIGTIKPKDKLEVVGSVRVSSNGSSWPAILMTNSIGKTMYWEMPPSGDLYLYDPNLKTYRTYFSRNGNMGIGTTNPVTKLGVNGTTRTNILEITGGNDIVEYRNSIQELEPGDLVVCDPTNISNVLKSQKAYDKMVIGIVSGAGGIKPGIALSQIGLLEGALPIAIAGIVKVKVKGKVEAGDLLTTSNHPGYAMKAKNRKKAFGRIIGKAIEPAGNDGLITILIIHN